MGNIGWNDAALVCICAIIVLLAALLFRRPLDIFPLGDVTARAVGLKVSSSRAILLALAGVGTTAATITIGPVSFIGLMVPHFAALLGFKSVTTRLLASALLGALLLVLRIGLGAISLIRGPCLQGCSHPSSGAAFSQVTFQTKLAKSN